MVLCVLFAKVTWQGPTKAFKVPHISILSVIASDSYKKVKIYETRAQHQAFAVRFAGNSQNGQNSSHQGQNSFHPTLKLFFKGAKLISLN